MEFIKFVNSEGKEEPRIMIKPYIYATMIDCSRHCIVYSNRKVKIIKKENNKND